MLAQRTLQSLTKAVGVGLHSGQRVELTLRPAAPDTGIVFRRVDLPQPVDIVISALAVTDTRLASTISAGHAMNNHLLRELLANKDAYEIVTFEDEKQAPPGFATVARCPIRKSSSLRRCASHCGGAECAKTDE